MKKIGLSIFVLMLGLNAQTSLFQVTDQAGKKVLDVTSNGLIILNPNSTTDAYDDTLMIITNTQIKTFVDGTANKGLARSVSVVSTASGKATQQTSLMSLRPDNYFIGHQSGAVTTGTKNTFFGYLTGKVNTTGASNIFIGNESGQANVAGLRNVFIGNQAGYSNVGNATSSTIGHDNIYIGTLAGKSISAGEHNTMIGSYSGYNGSGTKNTFVGAFTGFNATGLGNSCFGVDAGRNLTDGAENTYVGTAAASANTNGNRNTFVGYCSGFNSSGNDNVFLGYRAGQQETGSGKLYIANTLTSTPLIKGTFPNGALEFNTSGLSINNPSSAATLYLDSYNSTSNSNFVFQNSGVSKGYLGYNLGGEFLYLYEDGYVSLQNGRLGVNLAGGATQTLDIDGNARIRSIGSGAYTGSVNRMADGTLTTSTSDIRLKENIHPLSDALDKVLKLQGVNFTWKSDSKHDKKIGFIAQEVEKVLPELVFTNHNDGFKGINYAEMTAVLAESIKELNNKNKLLEEKNKQLENDLAEIKAMLTKLNK